ncbi:MAG: zinc-dependent dehydrogenase [Actinobacteria bacterium]|nr:zinc-dependent dehydrogenase [Actinomycetota bacterium]
MKAAVYYGIRDIRVEKVLKPQINDREVLVKCRAAAVCGTDLRIYGYGHIKIPIGKKVILGHELAGDVVEIGEKVSGVRKGARVAVASNIGCGKCYLCLQGFYHLCNAYEAIGLTYNGGFAEYVKVPEQAVQQGAILEIPDNLSYEEAALIEPMACVYNGFKRCPTEPGDIVLIFGAGPIGVMHIMMAKLAGASKIIVSEISDDRLKKSGDFGADVLINSETQDLEKIIFNETKGRGADVIITACPSAEAQKKVASIASLHGKVNFFGGLPKEKADININTNLIHYGELIITGSHGSDTHHCKMALNLIASGKINLRQLITNKFPLNQIKQAFEVALKGQGLKTIIYPDKRS